MQSYQLITKQTSWYRYSFCEESGKLFLISVTSRREFSKKLYKSLKEQHGKQPHLKNKTLKANKK